MALYEVTTACYVPVGTGSQWKEPGQLVVLDDVDAAEWEGYIKPVDEGVAERNTESESEGAPVLETEATREVQADAGEPPPADE